jgi:hypothetical protein
VLLLDGFIQQGVVNFHVILDLGFIFKMLGCVNLKRIGLYFQVQEVLRVRILFYQLVLGQVHII